MLRGSRMFHDMFVLPVPTLLEMGTMLPHQHLLQRGLLRRWTPDMADQVIFVSHQWLGWGHPDPEGEQFAALKGVLSRLLEGKAGRVESHWLQQLVLKENTVVTASEWKAVLPRMYVWLDFVSIPQGGAQSLGREHPGASEAAEGGSPEARRRREREEAQVTEQAHKAAYSIPAYIERSALFLVLAPVCEHHNVPEVCSLASWRSRGWCRAELAAAVLAGSQIRIMICTGAHAKPYFWSPLHEMCLPPGSGTFSCCERGHLIDGRSLPCDRLKVAMLLQAMFYATEKQLSATGQQDRWRALAGIRRHFLSGLHPDPINEGGALPVFSISMRDCAARWLNAERDGACGADEEVPLGVDGSLLLHAVVENDATAVSTLLRAGDLHPDRPQQGRDPLLGRATEMQALPLAMMHASFGIVEQLLDAMADPGNKSRGPVFPGMDALMWAVTVQGREANVRSWLERFPDWDLGIKEPTLGRTLISLAASIGPCKAEMVRVLLSAAADPRCADYAGMSPLHSLVAKEDSDPEAVRVLVSAAPDLVNLPIATRGRWHARCCFARAFEHMGLASAPFKEVAFWERCTPLHFAAARGDAVVTRVLLDARADPSLRNAQRLTPFELATARFGEDVPRFLGPLLSLSAPLRGALHCKPCAPPPTPYISPPHSPCALLLPVGQPALFPDLGAVAPVTSTESTDLSSNLIGKSSQLTTARLSKTPSDPDALANQPVVEGGSDVEVGASDWQSCPPSGVATLDLRDDEEVAEDIGCASDGVLREASMMSIMSLRSCTRGPLGVTALSICEDAADWQAAGLGQSLSSPAAVRGSHITWVRGEELGRGSLGAVFGALDQRTGQIIAVKEVPIDRSNESDRMFRAALEREISILQHLKHPHIVSYLGHDCLDSSLYIYLEYMPGGSVASVLAQFGAFEESLIAVYTRELLEGLEYLHTRRPPVVHRDIKGANVLVGIDCRVKLSDFGCSKRAMETLSRTMRGSVPWMAPEVIQQTGYGRSADIWSFGCVVIEMATGGPPWGKFDNLFAFCARIAMSEDTPPVPGHLSAVCRDFVCTCVQREPLLRPVAGDLLEHGFVSEFHACDPCRRSLDEYLETEPDYGTMADLLPGYLD